MKESDVLVESLEEYWKQFSKTWRLAKNECGESETHDLRVAARRFTSVLGLLDSAFSDVGADGVRRRFKKVLKRLGGLRDAQVQLLRARDTHSIEVPKAFQKSLETKIRSEDRPVSVFLQGGYKAKLRRRLSKLEEQLHDRLEETTPAKLHASLAREIKARHNVFTRARSRFVRSGEAHLHVMRIALKDLRYGVEGAAPLVNVASRSELSRLRALQKKLGNIRDLRILGTSLAEWAEDQDSSVKRKTKTICDRLDHQYTSAVTSLRSDSRLNGNLLPSRLRKPAGPARAAAREHTIAAGVPAEPPAAQLFERAPGIR